MYSCPMCGKAMQNMSDVWARLDSEIEMTPMPREYSELYRGILCKDCNKKSTAKFHIVGMKCGVETCGSYNTTEDGGFLKKDGETFRPLTDAELQGLNTRVNRMMIGRRLKTILMMIKTTIINLFYSLL